MRSWRVGVLLGMVGLMWPVLVHAAEAPAGQGAIDWNRARALYQREQRGERLTADEQTYLDRAKVARRAGQGPAGQGGQGGQAGGQAMVAPPPPSTQSTGLIPLSQMSAADRYKGEDGGLYGGGGDVPPEGHRKAAEAEAARIVPLDAEGQPSPGGKIVLMSLGMSNTTQEFSRFKQMADRDPGKGAHLVIVDAAQGGKDAAAWVNVTPGGGVPTNAVWEEADRRLRMGGVASQQVQVVWIKQAIIAQGRYGEFPKHAKLLQEQLTSTLNISKQRYPNLRIAYLSSRIYAGYARTPLNPEPYAYEGASAVRWVIQEQIKGEPGLNYDPAKGPVKSPLVLWGPYLWGDGVKPRGEDGLVWKREDFGADGTHPDDSGRQQVAKLLLKFFKSEPTAKGWFGGE